MTARTSLTPAVIADSSTKRLLVALETTYARVVFPVPGGPQRITEDGPAGPPDPSPTSLRRGEPGFRRCCWPTTSSRVRGRIRTARGLAAGSFSWRSSAAAVNRSGSTPKTLCHRTDNPAGAAGRSGSRAVNGPDRGRSTGPEVPPARQDQHADDPDV